MKWIAVALLLANALYFGWGFEQQLREAANAAKIEPLPTTAPSLRLIGELDQLPAPRTTELLEIPDALASSATPDGIAPSEAVPPSEPPLSTAPEPTIAPVPAIEPAPAPVTTEPEPLAPEIVAEAAPSPVVVSATTSTAIPADVCVEVGPFANAVDADRFETWVGPRAAARHRLIQSIRKKQLFWVYLEPQSAAQAQASVVDLQRKGVSDILLVQRDGLKNAISLGLFSSQDAVNRRLGEIEKQGYKPVVVPRITTTDLVWLRANLAVGYENPGDIPQDTLHGATVAPIDCGKIADPKPSP